MNKIFTLLAIAGDNKNAGKTLRESWNSMTSGTRDLILIFAAVSFVVLLIFSWALFIRLPKRQRAAFGTRPSERGFLETDEQRKKNRARRSWLNPGRRRSHRRRSERPRNPTLAETGGLPPIRDDDNPGNLSP